MIAGSLPPPDLMTLPGSGVELLPEACRALQKLQQLARRQGFDLAVASGYRSVERQTQIWNAKANNQRAVLDDYGRPLERATKDDWQWVQAILRWSALPGASRHHWGSDMDIYDRRALPADYQLQLTIAETQPGGIFGEFYQWLARQLEEDDCGFFRPFARDNQGVAPEPWHLSYRPLAETFEQWLSQERVKAIVESLDLVLKAVVMEHFDEIYQRFIRPPSHPLQSA